HARRELHTFPTRRSSDLQKIEDSARSFKYDLILMDIQLTETHLEEPRSGEDLGILARKLVPDTKVVFMSSFSDNYRINSILKNRSEEHTSELQSRENDVC